MHDQHRSQERMETWGTDDVAISSTPIDLHACVHTLDGGASLVQPFELLGGAGNRREAAQVELLLDAHGLAIRFAGIANRGHRALPAFMLGWATVFQSS